MKLTTLGIILACGTCISASKGYAHFLTTEIFTIIQRPALLLNSPNCVLPVPMVLVIASMSPMRPQRGAKQTSI